MGYVPLYPYRLYINDVYSHSVVPPPPFDIFIMKSMVFFLLNSP